MDQAPAHTEHTDFFAPPRLPKDWKLRRARWANTFRKRGRYDADRIRLVLEEFCRLHDWDEKVVVCSSLSDPTIRNSVLSLSKPDHKLYLTMLCYLGRYNRACRLLAIQTLARQSMSGFRLRLEGMSVALIARLQIRRKNISNIVRMRDSEFYWPMIFCSAAGFCMLDCYAALLLRSYKGGESKESIERVQVLAGLLREAVENDLGWLTLGEGTLIAIPMPRVKFDVHNRLHAEKEEAILWHDDEKEYWWHGVRVNQKMIISRESLTAEEILKTRNIEVRRVMIERYGLGRFVNESHAEKVHEDRDYGGTRQLFRIDMRNDEPILIVRVKCPSTGSDYILRVPPTMRTCDEAIAWTFGFYTNQYRPLIET